MRRSSLSLPLAAVATPLVALILTATSSTAIRAQSPQVPQSQQRAPSADERALATYSLTMPLVRRTATATEHLMMLAKDPAVRTRMQAAARAEEQRRGGRTSGASIDDLAALYDRLPEVKRAISSSNLTSRQYVLTQFALFQSYMLVSVMDAQKKTTLDNVPPGVNMQNVAFVRANRAQLDAIMQRLQELGKAMKLNEGSEPGENPPA